MISLNEKIKEKVEEDLINKNALKRVLELFEKNLDKIGFEFVGTEFKNGEPQYLVKIKTK
jgi:ribosome maturation factor RimP